MNNLLTSSPTADLQILGRPLEAVVNRLDALLMVLKSCKADSCRDPWYTLHPGGRVNSLTDALSPEFDAFYQEQPKTSFSKCELGYIISSEGPQKVNSFIR